MKSLKDEIETAAYSQNVSCIMVWNCMSFYVEMAIGNRNHCVEMEMEDELQKTNF